VLGKRAQHIRGRTGTQLETFRALAGAWRHVETRQDPKMIMLRSHWIAPSRHHPAWPMRQLDTAAPAEAGSRCTGHRFQRTVSRTSLLIMAMLTLPLRTSAGRSPYRRSIRGRDRRQPLLRSAGCAGRRLPGSGLRRRLTGERDRHAGHRAGARSHRLILVTPAVVSDHLAVDDLALHAAGRTDGPGPGGSGRGHSCLVCCFR
jgi:hypothetical protein